jgi:hypothetical protein
VKTSSGKELLDSVSKLLVEVAANGLANLREGEQAAYREIDTREESSGALGLDI